MSFQKFQEMGAELVGNTAYVNRVAVGNWAGGVFHVTEAGERMLSEQAAAATETAEAKPAAARKPAAKSANKTADKTAPAGVPDAADTKPAAGSDDLLADLNLG